MKRSLLLLTLLGIYFGGTAQIIKKSIPDKLVVLTFDDAPVTHFTYVAPLLKQYGFGATFYVCEFPPNFRDTTKYMTWGQIQQLSQMGFEIANHTHQHRGMSKLSREGFVAQLKYIEDKCDSLQIPRPTTFAYPGYDLDSTAFSTLKQRGYRFARAGGSRPYDPLTDHPYLLPSWATVATNRQQILEALPRAKDGKIVILTIHGVPDYEHPWVTTPPPLFREYLQYLHDQHYTVIALKDLQQYIDPTEAGQQLRPDLGKTLKN